MSIEKLDFAEPFFTVKLVEGESETIVREKSIVLNLAEQSIRVQKQKLAQLQSAIFANVALTDVDYAVLVERFSNYPDEADLFGRVKTVWPSAFEVRGEERLRGVSHYMSPKVWIGNLGLTMYHSGSVPLNVGLHKEHLFCDVPGFREVHTQIVGFGKMQQCLEKNVDTLYLEEPMAPGMTHRPMYDQDGNYPWHQFETITPSIFMAVEMLPVGATPPD
ncbi:MAG: hypothetical protein AAF543_15625 [Pseudomonadota bacterium]